MPRRSRLSREQLVSFLEGKNSRIRGEFFDLSCAENSVTQVACIVSKKIEPKASARNKTRRRLKAALAPILETLSQPLTMVFFAKKHSTQADFDVLVKDIVTLVTQAQLPYNTRI